MVDQRVQHFLHAEVVDGRPEEHRGLLAGAVRVGQHLRAAADHRAVVLRAQFRQAEGALHLTAFHQRGQAALVGERLAGDGRVVQQLVADHLAQELVLTQFLLEIIAVGQILFVAHAMARDHLLEALVGLRVLDHRPPRRHAGRGSAGCRWASGRPAPCRPA
ncbi:hypothetical protein G6F22_018193 [Rhizopus arrhizus]|nr:hypothetical protein G6F22_018193 [Rhizopus arrhizus]